MAPHRQALLISFCLAVLASVSAAPLSVPASPASTFAADGEVYTGPRTPPGPEVEVSWEVVAWNPILSVTGALIPGTNDAYLYYDRYGTGPGDYKAGLYTMGENNRMVNLTHRVNQFCTDIVPLADGRLILAGGDRATARGQENGLRAITMYDYREDPERIVLQTEMQDGRWYPTATLLPDGDIMIMGGTTNGGEQGVAPPFWEKWSPREPDTTVAYDIEPDFWEAGVQLFYPFNFVLPTGEVWTQIDGHVRIIKPDGTWRMDPNDPERYLEVPGWPEDIMTQNPKAGSATLTGFTYEDGFSSTELVITGGTPREGACQQGTDDATRLATRLLHRITISWERQDDDWVYTFGEWVPEDMGFPRVGHDSTLLPNGDIVITSGSQTGCAGNVNLGQRRNTHPAFWPVLYQPDRPFGRRITFMQASTIPRLYHNIALLTLDGEILVAGCDACDTASLRAVGTDDDYPFWVPIPEDRIFLSPGRDYRNEIFRPPYVFDRDNMPQIQRLRGQSDGDAVVQAGFGQTIQVEWTNDVEDSPELVNVTRVALVAPSASTHSFNNNQRLIFLNFTITSTNGTNGDGSMFGTLNTVMPPDTNVAPSQHYQLFLVNGKTYGRSRWVHLTDMPPAAQPSTSPINRKLI